MDSKERSILGIIVLVVLIVIFVASDKRPAKLPDCASGCSSITYDDIYYIFVDQGRKTSAQRYSPKELEDMWAKSFQDRCIYWQGKVDDVSKSTDGKVTVNINGTCVHL
jgi:hypothetical protein